MKCGIRTCTSEASSFKRTTFGYAALCRNHSLLPCYVNRPEVSREVYEVSRVMEE